jgi:ubiquinone/menaquinone biosynthesis C-methylase UbiE
MSEKHEILGWGKVNNEGSEIWDTNPVFLGDTVTTKDWLKLMFYPKKFLLYRWIRKEQKARRKEQTIFRVLDVGCGTGASVIDLKKIFGRGADVVGVDVVRLQIDLAKDKIKKHGVYAQVDWYDGFHLPFPDNSFDAVYTSDVLGHVENVSLWLRELNRVLKPGGTLAMFSESKLGKHAWIRKYLFAHGLNVDPHAQFHISLYSKQELKTLLNQSGFKIKFMSSVFWPAFLLHPEEFFDSLQKQKKFPILRALNRVLTKLKKKTYPYSTAFSELYGLFEILTLGRFVESQGYVILGKKR